MFFVPRDLPPDPSSYILTLDLWRGALADPSTMVMGKFGIAAPAESAGALGLKGEHVAVIGDGLALFYLRVISKQSDGMFALARTEDNEYRNAFAAGTRGTGIPTSGAEVLTALQGMRRSLFDDYCGRHSNWRQIVDEYRQRIAGAAEN